MTYLTLPRPFILLMLVALSLISCARIQQQNGDAAMAPLFNFWQQQKPQPSGHESAEATTAVLSSEPVQMKTSFKPEEIGPTDEPVQTAASADQKISHDTDDFFSGLTTMEIEKIRMEAWNTYGAHWETIARRSQYVRQPLLETLKKAAAPEALQMIPVVESSYDPYAQSEVGATGLWQLMPLTAEDLHIKSDRFVDGRREIEASTRGAAIFLLKQRKRFGNWPLAFAAYHLGPSGVQKRIDRRPWQPEDGLEKLPLPPITKTYIRHILGLIALHQVGELQFPEPFATGVIHVQTPVNLDVLHQKAELPKDQLFRFNPELNLKHYYGKKSSPIALRVTRWRVPAVKKHISEKPKTYMTIAIRKGERLKDIVKRYHTSVRELQQTNSGNLTQLARNGKLRIPAKLLKRVKAEKNPLVKAPVSMVADNSGLRL